MQVKYTLEMTRDSFFGMFQLEKEIGCQVKEPAGLRSFARKQDQSRIITCLH